MARFACAILLAPLLTLLASLSFAAEEDPRACLISRNPAEHKKLVATIRAQEFPGEVTGPQIPEDPYRKAAAERCVKSEGWDPAYTSAAAELLRGETYAQVIRPRLIAQGFNLDRLDAFIAAQPPKRLMEFEWLDRRSNPYSYDRNWPELIAQLDRSPTADVQKDLLLRYISFRAMAERTLQAFKVIGRPDVSRILSQEWQVLPALEAARPVIRERPLDKQDRSELSRAKSAYFASPAKGGRTLANLQKLLALAQSGDRDAMIAARDALALGVPADISSEYIRLSINTEPFRMLTSRLAAMWTAMIWHRFGYDDASRKHMAACVGGLYGEVYKDKADGVAAYLGSDGIVHAVNSQGIEMDSPEDACGFVLLGVPAAQAKGKKILQYYDKRGSFAALGNRAPARDFAITGVRFVPILGDPQFQQRKFAKHMQLRRSGLLFDPTYGQVTFATPTLIVSLPWYHHYAQETGQLAALEQADASANAAIAKRLREEGQRRVRRWEQALAAFQANPQAEGNRVELQYAASALGGPYWKEYERLVPNRSSSLAPRVVGSGSGSSSYREVEVRSYDSNGTYTGSTRVSAAWADIMKMTSSAPR